VVGYDYCCVGAEQSQAPADGTIAFLPTADADGEDAIGCWFRACGK